MKTIYEVCSINTRTGVVKMYFIWKLHVWVLFKVLSSSKHVLVPTVFPLLETVPLRFFCDGFQFLRRVCLNLRKRLEFSSFEGFLRFGNKKNHKEQGQVNRGWGRTAIERLAKNPRIPSAEWIGALS